MLAHTVGALDDWVLEDMSFDPWGHRREVDTLVTYDFASWQPLALFGLNQTTSRGFTGHEMLDEVGLIHMNGRVYDREAWGRFLQADPFIQAAGDTQMYNRYSYVRNNPLNSTDPSGFFLKKLVAGVVGFFTCGPACAAAAVAAVTYQETGSLKAALIAGVSTFAFSALGGVDFASTALGQAIGGTAAQIVAFGTVGGITSVLSGGKFGHGFVTAGLTAPLGGGLGKLLGGGPTANFVSRVVVGGTLSKATGGKFANGAAYAAFVTIVSTAAEEIAGPGLNEGNSPNGDGPPIDVDTSQSFFTEAEARAAAKVASLAADLGNEHAVFTVEQDGSFFNTHPITSGEASSVSINYGDLQGISDTGYRLVGVHHNHPTNPLISGSDVGVAGRLDAINGRGVMSPANLSKVTINYGGRVSFANQSFQPASVRQIQRQGLSRSFARKHKGNLFLGKQCVNYACN